MVVPPETTSAVTVMTSTVVESTSPSIKSMLEEPEITTSFVFSISTSLRTKLEVPRDSIPIPLVLMDKPDIETSRFVFNPYFNAAPCAPVMVPEKSVFRSLRKYIPAMF